MPPKAQKRTVAAPAASRAAAKQQPVKNTAGISAKKKATTVTQTRTTKTAKSSVLKPASVPPGGGRSLSKPKKSKWSKQDELACKIQTCFRAYRCRKLLQSLKRKKAEYEELMEKLQRDAFVQLVKLEQERSELERQREEEVRRKKREAAKRIKRMLEAAFDGDKNEIQILLKEVAALHADEGDAMIDRHQLKLGECCDPNKNSPLSEAGAGGHADTIRLLIDLGGNPNSKGQYGRTPLYRAAFAGHLEAVKTLLECGADPRIYADDGALPEQVSSLPELAVYFRSWDIAETEQLLQGLQDRDHKRVQTEKALQMEQEDKIKQEIDEIEKEHSVMQKQLAKAYEELNKRIHEHDTVGHLKPELTLQAVHDAEDHLERTKLKADDARNNLQQARLSLRMKRREFNDVLEDSDLEEEKADDVVPFKELDDVLMKDVGDKIASSGKWPLIVDPTKQAATFLCYCDTNYINACNPKQMEPESLRMALLGAIRYGKPAVVDIMDIENMWPATKSKLDLVHKDLTAKLMSKALLRQENYLCLVKPSDGEEYSAKMFTEAYVNKFQFVIVTQLVHPPAELLEQCYVIRIHVSDR